MGLGVALLLVCVVLGAIGAAVRCWFREELDELAADLEPLEPVTPDWARSGSWFEPDTEDAE